MLLIFFSNYSLFTFSAHYEIPRFSYCVKNSFHVKNILLFCRFVILCGRQLESVYLHIIIHGKEIQARIANLKKRNAVISLLRYSWTKYRTRLDTALDLSRTAYRPYESIRLCCIIGYEFSLLRQWYSTFLFRVPPDIISLQLCTPKVVGV
jgi:hypothetical protein